MKRRNNNNNYGVAIIVALILTIVALFVSLTYDTQKTEVVVPSVNTITMSAVNIPIQPTTTITTSITSTTSTTTSTNTTTTTIETTTTTVLIEVSDLYYEEETEIIEEESIYYYNQFYTTNELTYYSGPYGCYGASGRTLINNYSCACNSLPLGTIIHITSYDGVIDGDYRVDDTGGMGDNVIDIFYTDYSYTPYEFVDAGRIGCSVWIVSYPE